MDKRTVFAIFLALFVMMAYSSAINKFFPKNTVSFQQNTVSFQQNNVASLQNTVSSTQNTVSFSQNTISSDNMQHLKLEQPSDENLGFSGTNITNIPADNVDYEFSDLGGCLKSISIKGFTNLKQNEVIYDVFATRNAIFVINGFDKNTDLTKTTYKRYVIANGLEYDAFLKNGLEIKKFYKLSNNNYGLELELKIINNSDNTIETRYSIITASDISVSGPDDSRFLEGIISLNSKLKKIKPQIRRAGMENKYIGDIEWAGLQNKYFSLIVKPYQKTVSSTVSFYNKDLRNPNISIMLNYDTVSIGPRETVSHKFFLYSGPNNMDLMAAHQIGIENSLHFGVFGIISELLLSGLNLFYKIFHNYGIAIICLAFLTSILLYPLTFKSAKSMRQMQLLQPKISRLQQEHKGNPQKLNKEMLELYKKHKVNPFGGCLPLLLQMPVFIALYQALSRAIELKYARFLWIKDLSLPDKAFSIILNQGTGEKFFINIIPIFMAITMFFQQKLLTPKPVITKDDKDDLVKQQQKMMGIFMPILFGFIFYNMPSGLVLYWFSNSLIMLYQNIRIQKHIHVEDSSML